MLDYGLLERLCRADAPSGFEDEVREIILSEIKDYADKITVDNMGNVLVFKKGKETPKKKSWRWSLPLLPAKPVRPGVQGRDLCGVRAGHGGKQRTGPRRRRAEIPAQ